MNTKELDFLLEGKNISEKVRESVKKTVRPFIINEEDVEVIVGLDRITVDVYEQGIGRNILIEKFKTPELV